MNIYHLKRWPAGSARTGEICEMVVVARQAGEARRLANQQAGLEGAAVWTDSQRSTCSLVGVNRPSVVSRAVQP